MGTHNFQPSPFTSHLFSLNRSSNVRSALRSSACCENESMSVMPWQLRRKKKKQKTMEEKSRPCSPRPPTIISAKTRSYRSNQINFLNREIRTNFCHFCIVKDMKKILQKTDVLCCVYTQAFTKVNIN